MNIDSAFWSAAAASLAAITAWLSWRTQRQSFRHAARPELILQGWSRVTEVHGGVSYDCVRFSGVANVGQGAALNIVINASGMADDNRPTTSMSTAYRSLIAPGSTEAIEGSITLWWNNVAGQSGKKHCPIAVDIYCWDTTGIRFRTKYTMVAVEKSPMVVVANEVAPWVSVPMRQVSQSPVWLLKCKRWLSRVPLIRSGIKDP